MISPDPRARSGAPVVVWIAAGTWRACVDAARELSPADVPVVLLHVEPDEALAAARGAFAGLLGRGYPERDPGAVVEEMAARAGRALLHEAAAYLGRPCELRERHGKAEREVVAAADGAALLVLARDGEASRLGPGSLRPASRFVIDHAPCPVLLVWPEATPSLGTIPPHPPRPGQPRPPHHEPFSRPRHERGSRTRKPELPGQETDE